MHRVFGKKENVEYIHREGAYVILLERGRIGVIKTPKGYFLVGGGIEADESQHECIRRECMEETGFDVAVKEQLCTAEAYLLHEGVGYFHPVQTYYTGVLTSQVSAPQESDHQLIWLDTDEIRGKLYAEMQNWALEMALSYALCHIE